MMKISKKFTLVLTLLFALSVVLMGCSNKSAEVTKEGDSTTVKKEEPKNEEPKVEEPVELSWYFPNSPQQGLDGVNEALNELLLEKMNATVKLNLVDWGAYDQKINVMMSAGETFDLVFTATWSNNYFQNAAKGAFVPIDDLLDKYAPNTKKAIPDFVWPAVTVKGKIYGVPNYQTMAPGYGIVLRKDFVDKYNFDWQNANKLEDIEPYLEAVKNGEMGMIPLEYSKNSDFFKSFSGYFGMDTIGDSGMPGWMYLEDKDYKVVNQYDTPEFKEHIKLMRDWYKKGYMRQDAATLTDHMPDRKAGKIASIFGGIDLDTNDYSAVGLEFPGRFMSQSGVEGYDKKFGKCLLNTDRAAATITAISATSKNPEKSMQFLELMNSDVDVYNTMCYGAEGVNYKKVSENRVETIAEGGYQLWSNWELGNNLNAWYNEADAVGAEVDNKGINMWDNNNKNAFASPLLGFVFDGESVKSEIANCNTVIEELLYALGSGSVEPDEYHPIFIEKLQKAGADKIIAEKQSQLDQWRKDNGK